MPRLRGGSLVNADVIARLLARFARRHATTFNEISSMQSMQLELGAVVGVQEHYRANGFDIEVVNPRGATQFIVKTSTRGAPWNYSRIRATRKDRTVDIHMNLMVRGANDNGIYCVDVGITGPDTVPSQKTRMKWLCLENRHLRSFAEVKRLVVYPMLLAQFVGIVHEIKPRFLQAPPRRKYGRNDHLPPTLIVLSHFSGNSGEIIRSYPGRGFQINIAENFDVRVAWARNKEARSPLYWDDLATTPRIDSKKAAEALIAELEAA